MLSNGYGQINVATKRYLAHRLSWMVAKGPIPQGMFICHRCDTPACINPAHLFVGTQADNMADKIVKGRDRRGEDHGGAKLSLEQVEEIRKAVAEGKTHRALARVYRVSHTTIGFIALGKRWAHSAGVQ